MFDLGSVAFFLVLAANLALIVLVAGLAADRAREAWSRAVHRARHAEAMNQSLRAGIEAAETKASQITEQIAATKVKLEQAKVDVAAVKQRHASEPLPFVFRGTPTENFDPGGPIWEFLIRNVAEGAREYNASHPAAQWTNGRLYLIQAATQNAALAQLERRFPPTEGFQAILVKQHEPDPISMAG